MKANRKPVTRTPLRVPIEPTSHEPVPGDLGMPEDATGLVLFAHGSGSSRHSPRNRHVAHTLEQTGLATILIDLLTPAEEAVDIQTAELRFDIDLLAERLVAIIDWVRVQHDTSGLSLGLFGASTGAAAALVAASRRQTDVAAVVSRGGRPDLADGALGLVKAPTLLIVGGADVPVIHMNRDAMARMHTQVRLEIVPHASHLFEEPGTLDRVAKLASDWFVQHLTPVPARRSHDR
jgi:dienelactone hydrolase